MLLPRLLLLALSPSPAAVSSPGSRAGLHVGRWTTPPKRCPSSMVTDGPLLANGDAGAAVGGFRMSANGKQLQQSYYIGKMDFWTHQNVGPPGNTEWYSHVAPGHVTLRFGGGTPTSPGAGGVASKMMEPDLFSASQELLEARVNTSMGSHAGADCGVVSSTAIIAPDDNVLLARVRTTKACSLNLTLSTPNMCKCRHSLGVFFRRSSKKAPALQTGCLSRPARGAAR